MIKNFMHSGNPKANAPANSAKPRQPYESPRPAEPAKAETPPSPAKSASRDEGNKLIVGPNIKLKGSEITDCEILVVQGRVEASMNSRDIRIAEGGVFSGKAEIDVAEVRGHFEGELTARERLIIYATGRVTGTIRYGAVMIEEGGCLSGDVATLANGINMCKLPDTYAAKTAPAQPDQGETPKREQTYSAPALARTR